MQLSLETQWLGRLGLTSSQRGPSVSRTTCLRRVIWLCDVRRIAMSGHNGVVDDSNGGAIPTVVLTAVASLLAAAVIVGFAVLFIIDIVQTWKGTSPPTYSAGWVYTMTGVAAAVGGLVAVFLGQSPSKVTHKEDLGANLPKAIARSGVRPYFTSGLLI